LKKDDGSLIWKYAIKGASLKFENFGFDATGILCSPAVKDGLVAIGGRDGILYALDATNGNLKWSFDHGGSWVLATAMDQGTVFAASGSSTFVQAVDENTGKERWRFKSDKAVFSSIAVVRDMLYFGDYSGYLYALNNKNGKLLWRFPMGTRSLSSPVVAN